MASRVFRIQRSDPRGIPPFFSFSLDLAFRVLPPLLSPSSQSLFSYVRPFRPAISRVHTPFNTPRTHGDYSFRWW